MTASQGGTVRFAGRAPAALKLFGDPAAWQWRTHSLLGGLQELYTRVGETVVAGEPIGQIVW